MNQGWSDPSEIAKGIRRKKKKTDVLYLLQTETPVVCLN